LKHFSKNFVPKWCAKKMILWRKKISKKKRQKIGKNSLTLVLYHGFFPFFFQKLFFLVKNPLKNMRKIFPFFWNLVFVDYFPKST
jgi:fucose 4-O-acetylase-like acetyltransferase